MLMLSPDARFCFAANGTCFVSMRGRESTLPFSRGELLRWIQSKSDFVDTIGLAPLLEPYLAKTSCEHENLPPSFVYFDGVDGFEERCQIPLRYFESMSREKSWVVYPVQPWPTLPASAALRSSLIIKHNPQRVLLCGDADQSWRLLAQYCDVVVYDSHELRRELLSELATNEPHEVSFWGELSTQSTFDFVCTELRAEEDLQEVLERFRSILRPDGYMLVTTCGPGPKDLPKFAETMGYCVDAHFGGVHIPVLSCGIPIDRGDFYVLRRRSEPKQSRMFPSTARVYQAVDIHDVCSAESDEPFWVRLADAIASRVPTDEGGRVIRMAAEGGQLGWWDDNGNGLTIVHNQERAHLYVSVMPYHSTLEYAALDAVLSALAGEKTWLYRPKGVMGVREVLCAQD